MGGLESIFKAHAEYLENNNHLPPKCTIRIYSLSGQLVDIIEHNNPDMSNGTEIWDMQTKDQLEIAYGIYVYHIDAGDVGEKIGKFAVIK